MAHVRTKQRVTGAVERIDERDSEAIRASIMQMRTDYLDRKKRAMQAYDDAQKEVNRRAHELRRVDKHLTRINEFIVKHNIEGGK